MSTSGTRTYSYTRDDYAKAILRKCKIISRFEAPESEDINECVEAMNLFLGTMSDPTDPNGRHWLKSSAGLILSRGKHKYTLGTDIAVPLDTLVIRSLTNASSLTASTSDIKCVINEDFTVSHNAAIQYDDHGLLTSAISDFSADDNVIDEPLFGATGTWATGTGWSIGGGTASSDNTQTSASNLSQSAVLTSGTRYVVLTNVSSYTSGNLTPVAGSTRGTAITETGWNLQFLTASGTTMAWEAGEDFEGDITAVVVIPLTAALTMTLSNSFNRPATSAEDVFFYTSTISKPLKILTLSRRDRSGSNEDDQPLDRWNEAQYESWPDKDSTGDPASWYYEEKLATGELYLDSETTNMRDIIVFKYIPQAQYFTAASDELDIPDVGREMLIYNVAKRMAGEHGKPWTPSNEEIRREVTSKWMSSDPETVVMFFEPDRIEPSPGGDFA